MGKKKSPKAAQTKAQERTTPLSAEPAASSKLSRFALPLVLVAAVAVAYVASRAPTPAETSSAVLVANAVRQACRRPPDFIRAIGMQSPSLSTAERDILGLSVIEKNPQTGARTRVWQHPSWRQAGNLSAFTTDARGNIYVIPAPRVNVADNPPDRQNRIYKIANETGEMTQYFEFPISKAVNQRNPFAGMGLSYDCGSDSLFLSSVAGSSATEELGKLMRISLRDQPKVESIIDGFDGFGITTVDAPSGIAVIAGHARSADVLWFPLDQQANFLDQSLEQSKSSVLLSLKDLGPEGWDRARKIELSNDGKLIIRGTPFQYNLAQPAAQDRPTSYEFKFDLNTQKYLFERWMK